MFTREKVVMHEKLDVWVFLDILGNISLSLFFFFLSGGHTKARAFHLSARFLMSFRSCYFDWFCFCTYRVLSFSFQLGRSPPHI